MADAREIVSELEAGAALADVSDREQFHGYAVVGVPFRSRAHPGDAPFPGQLGRPGLYIGLASRPSRPMGHLPGPGASIQLSARLRPRDRRRPDGADRGVDGAAPFRPPSPLGLAVIGRAAGLLLRAGRVRLSGTVPSRQEFFADLRRIWLIDDSTALIGGVDVGEPGPLPEQAHLADFWLPQRGLFAIGASFFELYDAGRHLQVASSSEVR